MKKLKSCHIAQNPNQILNGLFGVFKAITSPVFIKSGHIHRKKTAFLACVCITIVLQQTAKSAPFAAPKNVWQDAKDGRTQIFSTAIPHTGNLLNSSFFIKHQELRVNFSDLLLEQLPSGGIAQPNGKQEGDGSANESTYERCDNFFHEHPLIHAITIGVAGMAGACVGILIVCFLLRLFKIS
jgi:hypothetical protein